MFIPVWGMLSRQSPVLNSRPWNWLALPAQVALMIDLRRTERNLSWKDHCGKQHFEPRLMSENLHSQSYMHVVSPSMGPRSIVPYPFGSDVTVIGQRLGLENP